MILYNLFIILLLSPAQKDKCDVFKNKDYWMSKSKESLVCSMMPVVNEQATKHEIDPDLILALINVESNWNHRIVSSANACGLTQVIPKYTGRITKKYTCEQLKDPRTSIKAGTKILRWWINWHTKNQPKTKYEESEILKRALCSYNAGFRCGPNRRPIRAGMRYAKKVLSQKQKIKRDYNQLVNSLN